MIIQSDHVLMVETDYRVLYCASLVTAVDGEAEWGTVGQERTMVGVFHLYIGYKVEPKESPSPLNADVYQEYSHRREAKNQSRVNGMSEYMVRTRGR